MECSSHETQIQTEETSLLQYRLNVLHDFILEPSVIVQIHKMLIIIFKLLSGKHKTFLLHMHFKMPFYTLNANRQTVRVVY